MAPDTKTRVLAYGVAWIIALLITASSAVQLLPLFPLGLFLAFTKPAGGSEMSLVLAGWLLDVIHAAVLFLTSSRVLYLAAYIVLIVMLLTNVDGCRKILGELSTIQ